MNAGHADYDGCKPVPVKCAAWERQTGIAEGPALRFN